MMDAPENPKAFPFSAEYGHPAACGGMSLRDYFAIHAPDPAPGDIEAERMHDRHRNPHNDAHKPALRSLAEIKSDLRYRFADAMLKVRQTEAAR